MSEDRMYDYLGQKYKGVEVSFTTEGEQWTNYKLEDGSSAKIKIVLMDMVRLEGVFTDSGDPVYIFTAQQVVGINANPELKRKGLN